MVTFLLANQVANNKIYIISRNAYAYNTHNHTHSQRCKQIVTTTSLIMHFVYHTQR